MSVKLVLVRGLPGSGKSTLAEKINDVIWSMDVEEGAGFVYETDKYWVRPDGSYDFNPRMLKESHEWNQSEVRECIERLAHYEGDTDYIVVSNTLTTLKEMEPYLDMIDPEDVVVVHCTNNYGSIHDVPSHTIAKMGQRWQDTPSHLREIKYNGENLEEVLDFVLSD